MCASKVAEGGAGVIIPIGGAEEKENSPQICGASSIWRAAARRHRRHPTPAWCATRAAIRTHFWRNGRAQRLLAGLRYPARCRGERPLERLNRATGFSSPRQPAQLSTLLGGTPVAKAVRLLNAGGVPVAGTSAERLPLRAHDRLRDEGAPVQGPSARARPRLTNRFIIDQHFRQRDRLGRLLTALAYNPSPSASVWTRIPRPSSSPTTPCTSRVRAPSPWSIGRSAVFLHGQRAGRPAVCLLGVKMHILTKAPPSICTPDGGRRYTRSSQTLAGKDIDAHPQRNVYVGPSMYAHFPSSSCCSIWLPRGVADGRLGGEFADALVGALPTLAEHDVLSRAGRAHQALREGEDLARPRARACGDRAAERRRRTCRSQDTQHRRTRVYTVVYEYAQRDEESPRANWASRCCAPWCRRRCGRRSRSRGLDWNEKRDEYIRYAQRRALGPRRRPS